MVSPKLDNRPEVDGAAPIFHPRLAPVRALTLLI
jgi:hypothetical protein